MTVIPPSLLKMTNQQLSNRALPFHKWKPPFRPGCKHAVFRNAEALAFRMIYTLLKNDLHTVIYTHVMEFCT